MLGAGAFEVPADRAWEELLNLLPPLDLSLQLGPVPNEQGEQQGQGHGGRDGRGFATRSSSEEVVRICAMSYDLMVVFGMLHA